jgi:hypothetical protein
MTNQAKKPMRVWSRSEKRLVRLKLAEIFPKMHDKDDLELLELAQSNLPESRRAHPKYRQLIPRPFVRFIEEERRKAPAAPSKPQADSRTGLGVSVSSLTPPAEAAKPATPEPPSFNGEVDNVRPLPAPTLRNEQPELGLLPTAYLLAEILTRFGTDLMARLDRIEIALTTRIALAAPPPVAPPPRPVAPIHPPTREEPHIVKPEVMRVAIVGLMKDQFGHVADRSKDLPLRCIWVDKEDLHVRLPQCDYCIVQRHSRHAWTDKAQQMLPVSRVFFVSGGISEVVKVLYDIHSRRVAEAVRG